MPTKHITISCNSTFPHPMTRSVPPNFLIALTGRLVYPSVCKCCERTGLWTGDSGRATAGRLACAPAGRAGKLMLCQVSLCSILIVANAMLQMCSPVYTTLPSGFPLLASATAARPAAPADAGNHPTGPHQPPPSPPAPPPPSQLLSFLPGPTHSAHGPSQSTGWLRPWETPFEAALQAALTVSLQQMAEQATSAATGAAAAALGEDDTEPLMVLDVGHDTLEADVPTTADDTSSELFAMSGAQPYIDSDRAPAGGAAARPTSPQPGSPRQLPGTRCTSHTGAASYVPPGAASATAKAAAGRGDMATAQRRPWRSRPARGGSTTGGLSSSTGAGHMRSGSSAAHSAGSGVARPASRVAASCSGSDGASMFASGPVVAVAGAECLSPQTYSQPKLGWEALAAAAGAAPQQLQEPTAVSVRALPIAALAQAGISRGLTTGATALGSGGSGDPTPPASGHLHRRRLSVDIPQQQLIEPPQGYEEDDAMTEYDVPADQAAKPLPSTFTLLPPPSLTSTVEPGPTRAGIAAASAAASAAAVAAASLLSAGLGRSGVPGSGATTLGQWIVQLVSSTAGAVTRVHGLCARTTFTATAEDSGAAGVSRPAAAAVAYKPRSRLLRNCGTKAGPHGDALTVSRRSLSDDISRVSRTEGGAVSASLGHGPGRTASGAPSAAQQLGQTCVFCGLRVRVGVSLGPTNPAEVSHNAASQRTVYGGAAAVLAKAVSDAAHGGMVTLTGDVFSRLSALSTSASGGAPKLPPHVVSWPAHVLHMRCCARSHPTHIAAVRRSALPSPPTSTFHSCITAVARVPACPTHRL